MHIYQHCSDLHVMAVCVLILINCLFSFYNTFVIVCSATHTRIKTHNAIFMRYNSKIMCLANIYVANVHVTFIRIKHVYITSIFLLDGGVCMLNYGVIVTKYGFVGL